VKRGPGVAWGSPTAQADNVDDASMGRLVYYESRRSYLFISSVELL